MLLFIFFDKQKSPQPHDNEIKGILNQLANGELTLVTQHSNPKLPRLDDRSARERAYQFFGYLFNTKAKNYRDSSREIFCYGNDLGEFIDRRTGGIEERSLTHNTMLMLELDYDCKLLEKDLNSQEKTLDPFTKHTISIMRSVTGVKIFRGETAVEFSPGLNNQFVDFQWSPSGKIAAAPSQINVDSQIPKASPNTLPPSQHTEPAQDSTLSLYDKQKCQKVLQQLAQQCEWYKKHLLSRSGEINNQKLNVLNEMIATVEDRTQQRPDNQIIKFHQQFEHFSNTFKKTDKTETSIADEKFKYRIIKALGTLGIYAVIRGYQLGTFKFWKSYKDVFKNNINQIEKKFSPNSKTP